MGEKITINMKYRSAFHLISDLVKKAGITCVLIGGFAVNYYKFSRQSADVDFLITEEDFNKIEDYLGQSGYTKESSQKVFVRLKSKSLDLMDIDFMFVDKETLGKITADAKEVVIAKHKFLIPSLINLIALKLHSLKYNFDLRRTKDLFDIVSLIKLNNLNAKTKKFHQLCLKYASEDIYQKILENI